MVQIIHIIHRRQGWEKKKSQNTVKNVKKRFHYLNTV